MWACWLFFDTHSFFACGTPGLSNMWPVSQLLVACWAKVFGRLEWVWHTHRDWWYLCKLKPTTVKLTTRCSHWPSEELSTLLPAILSFNQMDMNCSGKFWKMCCLWTMYYVCVSVFIPRRLPTQWTESLLSPSSTYSHPWIMLAFSFLCFAAENTPYMVWYFCLFAYSYITIVNAVLIWTLFNLTALDLFLLHARY